MHWGPRHEKTEHIQALFLCIGGKVSKVEEKQPQQLYEYNFDIFNWNFGLRHISL